MTAVTGLSVLYYKSPSYKKTAPHHRCGRTLSISRLLLKAHALKYFTDLASHQPLQNRTIPLTFRRGVGLPLPLHLTFPFPQPLQKNKTRSPRTTTLASLVKGEVDWRQGTNLNIIAFTCDMLTIFILQTFLPSRRRDCNTYRTLSVSLTPPLTIPQSQ